MTMLLLFIVAICVVISQASSNSISKLFRGGKDLSQIIARNSKHNRRTASQVMQTLEGIQGNGFNEPDAVQQWVDFTLE